MLEIAQSVSRERSAELLQKTIGKNDWKKIVSRHVPSSASIVDHQFHTSNGKVNKTLNDVINHTKTIKPRKKDETEGVSQKLIFDHPHLTLQHAAPVMIKPYHKKLENRAWTTVPITGWATMATKGLFNAGGIGHLAEDVTAGEHKGIPLTVHKLEPGMHNIIEHLDWNGKPSQRMQLDRYDLQRIAAMDFLTNNVDRHGGNLMVDLNRTNTNGTNPILAIDHERNFQYNLNPSQARKIYGKQVTPTHWDHPSYYASEHNPGMFYANKASHDIGWDDLAQWWTKQGPKVRKEMENQLAAIKDEHVRQHIRNNFNNRAGILDKWSADPSVDPFARSHNQEGPQADDNDYLRAYKALRVTNEKFPRKYKEAAAKVLSQLPPDPTEAVEKILANSIEMPYKAKNKAVLDEVMQDLADKMSPDQLANFMYTHHSHPIFNVRRLVQNRTFRDDAEHSKFVSSLRDMADKHPEMKKKFPFLKRMMDKTVEKE
jgi:hypothetical protein